MIIDEIATYLQEYDSGALGLTKEGTNKNLFKGFQPDSPDDCVTIYDTGGAESHRDVPIGYPTFQILVRTQDYPTGSDLIAAIHSALNRKYNETIGSTYFYYINDLGRPAHIGKDKNNREEFSVNFVSRIRE